jgi:hypothetical protein
MMKRIAAIAAAVLIALGLTAVPAQASVYGCPDGMYVCVYNYQSFNTAGGIYVVPNSPNVCHVMPTSGVAGWTNGKVYNATSSILLNWSGTNTVQRNVYFYDGNACSGTDYFFYEPINPRTVDTQMWRLTNWAGTTWNDRIGSIAIR